MQTLRQIRRINAPSCQQSGIIVVTRSKMGSKEASGLLVTALQHVSKRLDQKVSFGNRIPSLEPVHVLLLAEVRFRPHPAMRHGVIRVHFTNSALAIEDLCVLFHFLPFTGRG